MMVIRNFRRRERLVHKSRLRAVPDVGARQINRDIRALGWERESLDYNSSLRQPTVQRGILEQVPTARRRIIERVFAWLADNPDEGRITAG